MTTGTLYSKEIPIKRRIVVAVEDTTDRYLLGSFLYDTTTDTALLKVFTVLLTKDGVELIINL